MKKSLRNYVFFGNNMAHRILAKSISTVRSDVGKIIFVDNKEAFQDSDWQNFSDAINLECITFESDSFTFSAQNVKDFIGNGSAKLFFISKDADRNVSLALKVMETAKKIGTKFDDFALYIAPNSKDIEKFFSEKQNDIAKHFDVRVVNPPRLAAYGLVDKFKPVDCLEFDSDTLVCNGDIKIAVLGLTENSREALLRVYEQGRFEGSNFRVDIFDSCVKSKFESLKNKFSGFVSDSIIKTEEISYFNSTFFERDFGAYNLVVIDLGDDEKNIESAKNIQSLLVASGNAETTIAPYVQNISVLGDSRAFPNIVTFGERESVYSANAIINDAFMRGGKFVNDYYNANKSDSMKLKSWIGMSDLQKGANVSAANFNYSYIKILGRKNFAKFASSAEFRKWLSENPVKLDTLTKTEHLRWNAYLYSNGWDCLPLSGEIMCENKNVENKLHTCLVPFEKLKSVSEMFAEDYEQYDKDNVNIIYDIYKILNP